MPTDDWPALDNTLAARLARLALDCVHRPYPIQISHVLQSDGDARPPRALTPAFYGCYDWHSAVHGHWLLARVLRVRPGFEFAAEATAALERSLTAEALAAELAYLRGPGRSGFERPYGLAWLLTLAAELGRGADEPGSPAAARWSVHLAPLEDEAALRLVEWIERLPAPIRTGEHNQSMFASALVLDWAGARRRTAERARVAARALALHAGDRGWRLDFEPSAHDFLSPGLATADLMRRVLPPGEFSDWLTGFLPELPKAGGGEWLAPPLSPDPSDGKLAHLDGLASSRAWMLRGIARGLPEADPRRPPLLASAAAHAAAGLRAISSEHYAGSHWLGTFAAYALTDGPG